MTKKRCLIESPPAAIGGSGRPAAPDAGFPFHDLIRPVVDHLMMAGTFSAKKGPPEDGGLWCLVLAGKGKDIQAAAMRVCEGNGTVVTASSGRHIDNAEWVEKAAAGLGGEIVTACEDDWD